MTDDNRSGQRTPADVGNDERDSLGTADRVSPSGEEGVPDDLRDTWNVDRKSWNRPAGSVDPFEDISSEDIQDDRAGYRDRSGI